MVGGNKREREKERERERERKKEGGMREWIYSRLSIVASS